MLIQLIRIYEAHYPERLKAAYIVNASYYFTLLWQTLKSFIGGRTIQKIKIFSKDGWQTEVFQVIDPDTIPAFLGGNLRDPDGDPMCRTLICVGGTIPESYYIVKKKCLSLNPAAKKLVVNRFSKAKLTLVVVYPGSNLEYEFETKTRDIAFAVHYQENNNSKDVEMVPKQRIDTDMESESAVLKCEKAGKYTLIFDNTYSWLHSKEVYYTANVLEPEELKSQI